MTTEQTYIPTELEILLVEQLDIDPPVLRRFIKKKLRQLKIFYTADAKQRKKFENLTPLEKSRVLLHFLTPLVPLEETIEIIESCGALPKNAFIIGLEPTFEDLIEKEIVRCFTISILYRILAQHLGICDKGVDLAIGLPVRSSHSIIHFYTPQRRKLNNPIPIDPANGTFNRKPRAEWKDVFEPAIELEDQEAVTILATEFKPSEEQIKVYDKLDEKFKKTLWFHHNNGTALLKLKEYQKALTCFDKAIEINSECPEPWLGKGIALKELGDKRGALASYREILKQDKDNKIALFNTGRLLHELGKYQEAAAYFDKILALNPKIILAWLEKARALSEIKGCEDEAIQCFDKALELHSKHLFALNGKALLLAKIGKIKEALECYEKALSIEPEHATTLYNRACAYALMHEKEKMLKSLQKSIKLDEKHRNMAREDEDFKEYWDDEEFTSLV